MREEKKSGDEGGEKKTKKRINFNFIYLILT